MSDLRTFSNEQGSEWIARVVARDDHDYKGRWHLQMSPADGGEAVDLDDIRWNNERTAARTLTTMSVVELRRRLRSAKGRGHASGV